MNILGVDFSGANPDNNTWVSWGSLDKDTLTIQKCRPLNRDETANALKDLDKDGVAALDFPFSLPKKFAKGWCSGATEMPELWRKAAKTNFKEFCKRVKGQNYTTGNEPLRVGDLHFPGCYSCLHRTNPNMVPMTFYGMQLLARLYDSGKFNVPPLPEKADRACLLEVMPGAVLRSFDLPDKRYKGGKEWWATRKEILGKLPNCSDQIKVEIPDKVRGMCLGNHDCLDSVVAAMAAALWLKNRNLFRHPSDKPVIVTPKNKKRAERVSSQAQKWTELKAAKLEGWLYAPKHQETKAS